MNKYYNGKLFVIDDISTIIVNIDIDEKILSTSNKSFFKWFSELPLESKKILETYFINGKGNIELVIDVLKNFVKTVDYHIPYIQDIIYEIQQDDNGNFYGRELITGKIFPIIKKQNEMTLGKVYRKAFYYPKIMGEHILTTYNGSRDNFINDVFYESPLIDENEHVYDVKEQNKKIIASDGTIEFEMVRHSGRTQNICFKVKSLSNDISKCFIEQGNEMILRELREYYDKFGKGLAKKRFTKLITKLHDKNPNNRKETKEAIDYDLIKFYYPEDEETDVIKYINRIEEHALTNLYNDFFPLLHLSIYDIDKIVEKNDVQDFSFKYHISVLYTLCLYDLINKGNNYNFDNSYIHNYLDMIIITIKRLYRHEKCEFPLSVFDNLNIYEIMDTLRKNKVKTKKLV